jgi:hypothetical protein
MNPEEITMPRPGRLLQDLARDEARGNTPEAYRARLIARRAGELGHADAIKRFPGFVAEDLGAVLRYQEERIAARRLELERDTAGIEPKALEVLFDRARDLERATS